MKEFVTEKQQIENVKTLQMITQIGGIEFTIPFLENISMAFGNVIENMKKIKINGQEIEKTKSYKANYPVFRILSHEVLDLSRVLKSLDIDLGKTIEQRKNKGISDEELIISLADKINSKTNKKLVDALYLDNNDNNRIINALIEHETLKKKARQEKDSQKRRYLALGQYKDAYEIYLKILKELYSKLEDIKIKIISNRKMYSYFNRNHKEVLKSTNNLLRNDVAHLNYNIRDNYDTKQIERDSDEIIIKAMTAIIARQEIIAEFFNKSIESIKKQTKSQKNNEPKP